MKESGILGCFQFQEFLKFRELSYSYLWVCAASSRSSSHRYRVWYWMRCGGGNGRSNTHGPVGNPGPARTPRRCHCGLLCDGPSRRGSLARSWNDFATSSSRRCIWKLRVVHGDIFSTLLPRFFILFLTTCGVGRCWTYRFSGCTAIPLNSSRGPPLTNIFLLLPSRFETLIVFEATERETSIKSFRLDLIFIFLKTKAVIKMNEIL